MHRQPDPHPSDQTAAADDGGDRAPPPAQRADRQYSAPPAQRGDSPRGKRKFLTQQACEILRDIARYCEILRDTGRYRPGKRKFLTQQAAPTFTLTMTLAPTLTLIQTLTLTLTLTLTVTLTVGTGHADDAVVAYVAVALPETCVFDRER